MKTIVYWTSHNGENGPDTLMKEFDLSVIPRVGEELCLSFRHSPPMPAPDGSDGPDHRGLESHIGTSVIHVAWQLLETGELVPEISIEDSLGLEEAELAGLLALGWKKA
jgi:hypothetical protein